MTSLERRPPLSLSLSVKFDPKRLQRKAHKIEQKALRLKAFYRAPLPPRRTTKRPAR
jgi:hypothetical protein